MMDINNIPDKINPLFIPIKGNSFFLSLIRMVYFHLFLIRMIYYLSNDIINDLFFIYYYSAKKGLS